MFKAKTFNLTQKSPASFLKTEHSNRSGGRCLTCSASVPKHATGRTRIQINKDDKQHLNCLTIDCFTSISESREAQTMESNP